MRVCEQERDPGVLDDEFAQRLAEAGITPVRTRDEAERLLLNNYGLVISAINKNRRLWPNKDRDEAEGVAALAFWRCCLCWDESKGTLGNLAFWMIERYMKSSLIKSIKCGMTRAPSDGSVRRAGMVYDREVAVRDAEIDDIQSARWFRCLPLQDRDVFRLRAEGMTFEQVGNQVGLGRQTAMEVFHDICDFLIENGDV